MTKKSATTKTAKSTTTQYPEIVQKLLDVGEFSDICNEVLSSDKYSQTERFAGQRIIAETVNGLYQRINQHSEVTLQSPALQFHINRWGWNFLRAGVVVRDQRGKYLCVEETRAKVNGVYQDVYDIWNLPSGATESTLEGTQAAAIREVKEETGYDVKLTGLLYITQKRDQKFPYLMVVYAAEVIPGGPTADFNHQEIRSIRWMSAQEIADLHSAGKLRSPHFMLRAIELYEKQKILPLHLVVER